MAGGPVWDCQRDFSRQSYEAIKGGNCGSRVFSIEANYCASSTVNFSGRELYAGFTWSIADCNCM